MEERKEPSVERLRTEMDLTVEPNKMAIVELGLGKSSSMDPYHCR